MSSGLAGGNSGGGGGGGGEALWVRLPPELQGNLAAVVAADVCTSVNKILEPLDPAGLLLHWSHPPPPSPPFPTCPHAWHVPLEPSTPSKAHLGQLLDSTTSRGFKAIPNPSPVRQRLTVDPELCS